MLEAKIIKAFHEINGVVCTVEALLEKVGCDNASLDKGVRNLIENGELHLLEPGLLEIASKPHSGKKLNLLRRAPLFIGQPMLQAG